eukprot:TRINITY_DN11687_c1_g1_i1.p1 TRINITY_DN11687_c1_g1~~TRINITY_DN11687_c1_g1_i1.p1  ORF type:complete len:1164 (+),score=203.74 TRINITY_DN11687_c1_g1_i1:58-3549(+)
MPRVPLLASVLPLPLRCGGALELGDSCVVPLDASFYFAGVAQHDPCTQQLLFPAPTGGDQVLFLCEGEGAALCDGDGNAHPVNCTRVGTLGCNKAPTDAAFGPGVVYAACGSQVSRCDWSTAGPSNGVIIPTVAADSLVLSCGRPSLTGPDDGMVLCPLTSPGGAAIAAGGCATRWSSPCDGFGEGVWLDPPDKLVVACNEDYEYCNFSVQAGPTSCVRNGISTDINKKMLPCDNNAVTYGIVELSTGRTGVACGKSLTFPNMFWVCGPTLPPSAHPIAATASPTQLPQTSLPTVAPAAASTSSHPTAAPTAAPAPPSPAPSQPPSADPSRPAVPRPSGSPRAARTARPSAVPSAGRASEAPSRAPVPLPAPPPAPSAPPTAAPPSTPQTTLPSRDPAVAPTRGPSVQPTVPPRVPSAAPTLESNNESASEGAVGLVGGDSAGSRLLAATVFGSGAGAVIGPVVMLDIACNRLGTLRVMGRALHPTQLTVDGSVHLGCLLGAAAIIAAAALFSGVAVAALRRVDTDGDGMICRSDVRRSWLRWAAFLCPKYAVDIKGVARHPNVIISAVIVVYQGASFSALRLLIGEGAAVWHRMVGCIAAAATLLFPFWLRRRVVGGVRPTVLPSDPPDAVRYPLARLRPWELPRPPVVVQYLLLSELGDWVSTRRERHWALSWQTAVRQYAPNRAAGAVTVQFLSMWALGLANAPSTPTLQACGHVRLGAAGAVLAPLLWSVVRCPYRSARDAAVHVCLYAALFAGLLVLGVEFYQDDHRGSATVITILDAACYLALSRVAVIISSEALLLVWAWRDNTQDAEWASPAQGGARAEAEAAGEGDGVALKCDYESAHSEPARRCSSPAPPAPSLRSAPQATTLPQQPQPPQWAPGGCRAPRPCVPPLQQLGGSVWRLEAAAEPPPQPQLQHLGEVWRRAPPEPRSGQAVPEAAAAGSAGGWAGAAAQQAPRRPSTRAPSASLDSLDSPPGEALPAPSTLRGATPGPSAPLPPAPPRPPWVRGGALPAAEPGLETPPGPLLAVSAAGPLLDSSPARHKMVLPVARPRRGSAAAPGSGRWEPPLQERRATVGPQGAAARGFPRAATQRGLAPDHGRPPFAPRTHLPLQHAPPLRPPPLQGSAAVSAARPRPPSLRRGRSASLPGAPNRSSGSTLL